MPKLSAKYEPGQRVKVGDGTIEGVVETVKFGRNMTTPIYEIEWMHNGDIVARLFHEQDLSERED